MITLCSTAVITGGKKPMGPSLMMGLVVSLCKMGIVALQAQHVRQSGSIYGLSLDFVLLSFVETLCMAFFTLGYRQPYVQRQYARRFPVHPKVPISTTNELVYMACIPIVLYLGLLCYNNRQSRHRFQYISTYTKGFVIMITLVTIWILSNVHYKQEDLPGRHGQFLIDLFDFLWLMSQVSSVIKWFPQFTTNFLGMHFCSASKVPLFMEMASSTMILLLRSQADYRDFFKFPLVSVLITVISLSVTDVTNKNRDVVLTAALRFIVSLSLCYQLKIYGTDSKALSSIMIKDIERLD